MQVEADDLTTINVLHQSELISDGLSGRMIWWPDTDELEVTPALAVRLFASQERWTGESLRRRIASLDQPLFDDAVAEAVRQKTSSVATIAVQTAHDWQADFLCRIAPIAANGPGHGLVLELTDVTLLRSAMKRARERQVQAEEANQKKGKWLADVSHELRTPLNGILGMAQLLHRSELSGRQSVYVEKLQAAGSALASLIDDVLDMTGIEAGRLVLYHDDVDVANLLDDLTKAAAGLAAEKRLNLISRVDPALIGTRFRGDVRRIRQVLLSLVSNGVKYTDEGTILVAAEPAKAGIRFSVKDTGPGVHPKHHAEIFERFNRGSVPHERGTGLGLAIAKELVEKMGGQIGVASAPGMGATFYFDLPTDGCS